MVDDPAGEWVGPMTIKDFIETRNISFLNDWDLATHVKQEAIALQSFRRGTWPFMSIALLETPGKINTLQDDLESFFWVVLYHALFYMVHSLKLPNELKEVMMKIFDEEHGVVGEAARGGTCKRVLLVFRKPLGHRFAIHGNIPLTSFIDTILDSGRQWHLHVDDYERKIAKTQNTYGISRDEAIARYPFDDKNMTMRNHDGLILVLEDVLLLDKWPENDSAHDNLGK